MASPAKSRSFGNLTWSSRGSEKIKLGELDDTSVSPEVRGMLTFEHASSLCRGSPLSVAMRRQGSIFVSSAGSAATYSMSQTVDQIGYFISHNWSTPRSHKFFALALKFNLPVACAVSLLWVLLLGLAGAWGWLPDSELPWNRYPKGYLATVTTIPIFLVVFFFQRDVLRFLPEPIIFLDKTCINQEDPVVMRSGIEKLGAFLKVSDRMFVCYTDVYLTKLWTVYELASFLSLYPARRMVVVPLLLPRIFVGALLFFYVFTASGRCLESLTGFVYVELLAAPLSLYALLLLFRRTLRSKRAIFEMLRYFSVHNCICMQERDRALVYANIAGLMRAVHGLGDGTPQEVCLALFDAMVRSELPAAIQSSLGRRSLGFTHTIVIAALASVPHVADSTTGFAHGCSFHEWSVDFPIYYSSRTFVTYPLTVLVLDVLSSVCLQVVGWREQLLVLALTIVTFVVTAPTALAIDFVISWEERSGTKAAIQAAGILLVAAVVLFLFWCLPECGGQPEQRPRGAGPGSDLAAVAPTLVGAAGTQASVPPPIAPGAPAELGAPDASRVSPPGPVESASSFSSEGSWRAV